MKLPKYCVVDTNVPIVANGKHPFDGTDLEKDECMLSCIEAIEYVKAKKALIIDQGDEIFTEYLKHLSLSGQPGVGDKFIKWVHDFRWQLPNINRVKITKKGDTYKEFPEHAGLKDFDISDRKFIAISNAHSKKPPILEATDSKWWGWQQHLQEVGISLIFLCPQYIERKFNAKFPDAFHKKFSHQGD